MAVHFGFCVGETTGEESFELVADGVGRDLRTRREGAIVGVEGVAAEFSNFEESVREIAATGRYFRRGTKDRVCLWA